MGKLIDLTGQTFERLTVISRGPNDAKGKARWQCRCQCGQTTLVRGNSLRTGLIRSCGCLQRDTIRSMGKGLLKDLTGNRFGRLLVMARGPDGTHQHARWHCVCDCGTPTLVLGSSLRSGQTQSCGCLRLERIKLPPGQAARNSVLQNYQRHARDRQYEWQLDDDAFDQITQLPCAYCGKPPSNEANGGQFRYNGLDRINNTLGYTRDNVVACCYRCNRWKSDLSRQEFLTHVQRIATNGN